MYQTLDDLEKNKETQSKFGIRKIITKIFLKWLLWVIILFFWFICLLLWEYISYLWYDLLEDYFIIISLIISSISMIIFIFMTMKLFNTQNVIKSNAKKAIIRISLILLILSLPSTLGFLFEEGDYYLLIVLISIFLIWLIAFIIVFIKMLMTEEPIRKRKRKWLAIVIGTISLISCYGFGFGFYYARSSVLKPIIYLYPTEETQINVELWSPENLSHTYPKYNSEKWRKVIAQPNWELEDMDTWRKLYALYREWKSSNETNFDEWFVVEWKDIIPFLEEKLAILWLNEREAEEFIVYWLPQMENNKYNLIRFETIEEQNQNMPLNITPTPDTVIRVMMDWKAIDKPIDIPEQQLITPERNGFTVVEWWGSPRN